MCAVETFSGHDDIKLVNISYQLHTVEIQTYLGEDEDQDSAFLAYLEEYSISYEIKKKLDSEDYPTVTYTGGPVSLRNMLKERFGMDDSEIDSHYPEIYG